MKHVNCGNSYYLPLVKLLKKWSEVIFLNNIDNKITDCLDIYIYIYIYILHRHKFEVIHTLLNR